MNGNLIPISDILAAADQFEANGSALADSLRLLAGELWVRRLFYVYSIDTTVVRLIPESEVTSRAHIPNSLLRMVQNTGEALHDLNWQPVYAEITKQLMNGELDPNLPQGPDDHDADDQQS